MKVLEPGKQSKIWTLQHRCTGWDSNIPTEGNSCGALLELGVNDLVYYKGNAIMDYVPTVSFKCVCCGAYTDVGLHDWPPNYRNLEPMDKKTYRFYPQKVK